jgi:hypothetical protein
MYWYVYFFCARYMLIFQDDSNKKYLWSIPLSPSNILNETHPSVDPVQVYPPTPADSRGSASEKRGQQTRAVPDESQQAGSQQCRKASNLNV